MNKTILTFLLVIAFLKVNAQKKMQFDFEIYFNNNSPELLPKCQNQIKETIEKYKTFQIKEIIVSAHCDSKGNDLLNNKLSEKRAINVVNYIQLNLSKTIQVSSNYYGKSKLKYFNGKDTLNRRAEISIIYFEPIPFVQETTVVAKDEPKVEIKKTTVTEPINPNKIAEAKVGETITFNEIQFYPGQAVPLPKSLEVMQQIADVLNENPTIEIEIQGHICCVSTDDENISTKRAKCVYDFLIEQGISKNRLSYKGFGHTRPKTDESTAELAQMNRRVEIKIVKK